MSNKVNPRYFFFSLIFAIFMVVAPQAVAQVEVEIDISLTPEELVQQVLLGGGVSVFNITANGGPPNVPSVQFGRFSGNSTVVDFPVGLLMGSNNVTNIAPNPTPGVVVGAVTNDPDLMALSNQNMNNCAILEFDFIPNGDSLEFRYVFGSREYGSFTCTNFNDVFGFFISGPGFNGPFTDNAENIALIPGTNIPVGINTVNQGFPDNVNNFDICLNANPNFENDSIYYITNPMVEGDITLHGLTVTLTAFANVICGETYHIKLAIGDASDFSFPSFVFLEAESFSSNSAVQVSLDIPVGINDSTLYRGCGEAQLQFVRPLASSGIQEVAYLNIEGTAINGVDVFPILPDSIVFPSGIDTVTFMLNAPFLGTAVGLKTFKITITNIASDCGDAVLTSDFTFYISDAEPLTIQPGGSFELVDCNDEVQLIPEVTGGYGEYRYTWSSGSTSETITASPGFTTNYFLTVSDTCNAGSVSTSFNVQVPVYPPIIVTLPDDITLDICDVPVFLTSQAEGGFGNYSYTWRNMNTNEIIGTGTQLEYVVTTTTLIRLFVTDECGATGIDDIEVIVPPVEVGVFLPDLYTATTCTDDILLPAISQGGIGETTYSWFVDGEQQAQTQSQFFVYHPSMGQNVVIRAEDECGNFGIDSTFIAFNFPPVQVKATPDTSICLRTDALLRLEASGGQGNFRYQWLQGGETSDTIRVAPRSNARYEYIVTDTCGVQRAGGIRVNIREVDARFEFDRIPYYGVSIRNLSRPLLESTYEWDFGDGNRSTAISPTHQYEGVDAYTISLTITDAMGCQDEFSRRTTPPVEVYIPSAFSPNGDGINELWRINGANISEFELWIYDRWGKQVFHTKDVDQGWNGSHNGGEHHNNMNLYNYFIRYKGKVEEDTFERTGSIVVIR